ncbi:hypothetical protein OBJ99_08620 [Empedobacter falsenii]
MNLKILLFMLLINILCNAQEINPIQEDLSYLNGQNLAIIPGYDDTKSSNVSTTGIEMHSPDIVIPKNSKVIENMKNYSSSSRTKGDAIDEIFNEVNSKIDISGGYTPIQETHNQNSDGSWSPKYEARIGENEVVKNNSTTEKVGEAIDEYFDNQANELRADRNEEENRFGRVIFFSIILIVGSSVYWIFKKNK